MKILIAEDEQDLRELLKDNLVREGHTVFTVQNGAAAWDIFNRQTVELCILDVMMPEMDGFELVKRLRAVSDVPVIFLTARDEEADRVLGLSLGGDDYLVKPFSMAELKARVQVQARHMQKGRIADTMQKEKRRTLTCGELRLSLDEAVCYKNSVPISLGAKELVLLQFFMENQGRVFTKKQIYHAAWQEEYLYDDNTVMVHLSRLRSKLEANPKGPKYLITIRGVGYKFNKIEPCRREGETDEP